MSYALHLGKNSNGLKTISDIKKCSNHNLRNYKSDEYDKNNIVLLVGSTNILDDVKKVYDEEFSEAIKIYNSNQVRNDRIISNYLEDVSENKKNDVACELIIQVGNKEYWSKKRYPEIKKKVMTKIFKNQIDKLNELLPNFKIANATAHFDEASPHLHIVGVPIANFNKGLKKRVSKSKVFTKESLSKLQDEMRKNIEKEMVKNYPDFKLVKKEKGRNRYFTVDEYKAIMKKLDNLENFFDIKQKINQIDELKKNTSLFSSKIKVEPDFLRMIQKYLKVAVTKDKIKKQFKDLNTDFENFKLEYSTKKDIEFQEKLLSLESRKKDIEQKIIELQKYEKYISTLDIFKVLEENKKISTELSQKNDDLRVLNSKLTFAMDNIEKFKNIAKFYENECIDLQDENQELNYLIYYAFSNNELSQNFIIKEFDNINNSINFTLNFYLKKNEDETDIEYRKLIIEEYKKLERKGIKFKNSVKTLFEKFEKNTVNLIEKELENKSYKSKSRGFSR